MAPLNRYQAPSKLVPGLYELDTPADEYDMNFLFDVPEKLESNGVELVPFVPSLHARAIHTLLKGAAGDLVYRFLPYGPFPTLESFLTWHETMIHRDPESLLLVIVDKTWSSASVPAAAVTNGEAAPTIPYAGIIAYRSSSRETLLTEIGHVAILPHFQRSHIATHSIGLMLQHAFDVWHLRRVIWTCHSSNGPSRACAERLGLKLEGTLRWDGVLEPHKEEVAGLRRLGRPMPGHSGRMKQLLAICWDDWEDYGAQLIKSKMQRELIQRVGSYPDWINSPR